MLNLLKTIDKKVNGVVWSLAFTGIILVVLALLIVVYDFALKILVSLFILAVATTFFHGAYKIYAIKRDLEKHFGVKK